MTSDAASSSGPDTPPRTSAVPESPTIPEPATSSEPPAVPDTATPDTTPEKTPATTTRPAGKDPLRTRAGATWVSLVAAAIIGIILLVFILQNLNQVKVTLFFWSFSLPLGVTILLSLIAGSLVMGLAGGWRIMQLRRAAKRA
ncbi:lipopolysaccharide assembly protein LapA domain-containing protein [Nocardia sp. CA2R105]|uniref:lipopolysaccharide assembly protein LapA domain-containing protein n=1 Tax=Nocardia coffeae TaxID=2873381 RepID=UPI001CA6AC79|nr:lipopolysaccharide assembly protein LapA domain-containing protein [Nocardia coffeae]MBY8856193.1 lipopolysaccharide assembly protein LapA domain-containing protein [Nocardia coffeae]